MRPPRLLARLLAGHHANVRFGDLVRLLTSCGFEEVRVRGSHHVFVHPGVATPVNLQDVRGNAKPYQVRQVATLLRRYDLHPGGDG